MQTLQLCSFQRGEGHRSATHPKEGTCSAGGVIATFLPLLTIVTLENSHETSLRGVQGHISKPKAPIAHAPFILPGNECGLCNRGISLPRCGFVWLQACVDAPPSRALTSRLHRCSSLGTNNELRSHLRFDGPHKGRFVGAVIQWPKCSRRRRSFVL